MADMPPAVINCDTVSVFKSRLKTHLFNTAYSYLACSASASEATTIWRSTNVLFMGDLIGMCSLDPKNFGALHPQFWRARTATAT